MGTVNGTSLVPVRKDINPEPKVVPIRTSNEAKRRAIIYGVEQIENYNLLVISVPTVGMEEVAKTTSDRKPFAAVEETIINFVPREEGLTGVIEEGT